MLFWKPFKAETEAANKNSLEVTQRSQGVFLIFIARLDWYPKQVLRQLNIVQNSVVGLQYCSKNKNEYFDYASDLANSANETIDWASVCFFLVVKVYPDFNIVYILFITQLVIIAVNWTYVNKLIILHISKIDEVDFLFNLVYF